VPDVGSRGWFAAGPPISGRNAMQRSITASALAAGLLTLVADLPSAWAQNPQPAPPTSQQVPVAPPNAPNPPPEKIAPGGTMANHGTKKPSNVDPGITVKPPANTQGTMPVVPPPGTPGGDQHVVPK
jgi:hypothetical protein